MCVSGILKRKRWESPVVELFGGPTRDDVRVYWSHCGSSRARNYELIGVPPLKSMDSIAALGREVVERGFTALKTNVIFPGDTASVHFGGFGGGPGTTDGNVTTQVLRHIETLIGTFREAVGPDVSINLDLNFNFKPEACMRIAKVLEQFDMLWLEIDMYDHEAIRQIKDSTTTKICTGENLYYMREYLPYFQCRAADVFMIDVTVERIRALKEDWGLGKCVPTQRRAAQLLQSPCNPHECESLCRTAQCANHGDRYRRCPVEGRLDNTCPRHYGWLHENPNDASGMGNGPQ